MSQTLREVLSGAGFKGQGLETAVAVCMAESGGRPMAHNGNAGTGDNSYGLFQINMLGSLGPARLKQYGLTSYDQLYDPATNARIAYQMSGGGTNWQPWTTYTRGTYTKYLGADPPLGGSGGVGAAGGEDGSLGDDTGGGGTTDPGADTGHDGGLGTNFDIGTGVPLSQVAQSDADMSHIMTDLPGGNPLPPLPTTTGTGMGGTGVGGNGSSSQVDKFVAVAVAQRGDSYVFGAKGTGQADPTAFDCSGLTQWAAHQVGVELPAGAAHQYLALKAQGAIIPVDQAINTPGALLFDFDGEPSPGGEPEHAHVAISLGNGKTIEAANPDDGVDEFTAKGRFKFAAVIPGIAAPTTTSPTALTMPAATSNGLSGLVDPIDTPDIGDVTTHDALPTGGSHTLVGSNAGVTTWDVHDLFPGDSSLGAPLGSGHSLSDPGLDLGSDDGLGNGLDLGHH